MRARIISRGKDTTNVEITLKLGVLHDNDKAAFSIDDDDVPDALGELAYIGGCGFKDGQLVVTDESGLFLPDCDSAPQANKDLVSAVVNAINAAFAGANAPGGKS